MAGTLTNLGRSISRSMSINTVGMSRRTHSTVIQPKFSYSRKRRGQRSMHAFEGEYSWQHRENEYGWQSKAGLLASLVAVKKSFRKVCPQSSCLSGFFSPFMTFVIASCKSVFCLKLRFPLMIFCEISLYPLHIILDIAFISSSGRRHRRDFSLPLARVVQNSSWPALVALSGFLEACECVCPRRVPVRASQVLMLVRDDSRSRRFWPQGTSSARRRGNNGIAREHGM